MKTILLVVLTFTIYPLSNQLYAQPLRVDFTGGEWNVHDYYRVSYGADVSSDPHDQVDLKVSYFLQTLKLSTIFHINYHFPFGNFHSDTNDTWFMKSNGILLDVGIEKQIEIGYSRLAMQVGVGYSWEQIQAKLAEVPLASANNNNITYVAGLAWYLPFLKSVDAVFVYTLAFKKEQFIDGQFAKYTTMLQTAEFHHIFSLGVSFSVFGEKEN